MPGRTTRSTASGPAQVKDGELRGIEVSVQQDQAVDLPAVQTANVTLYEKFDVVLSARLPGTGSAPRNSRPPATAWRRPRRRRHGRPPRRGGRAGGLVSRRRAPPPCWRPPSSWRACTAAWTRSPPRWPRTRRPTRCSSGCASSTTGPSTRRPRPARAGAGRSPVARTWSSRQGDQSLLDGTWRLVLDAEDLIARGVPAHDAEENAGVWEFRFEDGHVDGVAPDGLPCNANYAINGRRVLHGVGSRRTPARA